MKVSSSEAASMTSEGMFCMKATKGKGGRHEPEKKPGSHERKHGGTEGSDEVGSVADSSDTEVWPPPGIPRLAPRPPAS